MTANIKLTVYLRKKMEAENLITSFNTLEEN